MEVPYCAGRPALQRAESNMIKSLRKKIRNFKLSMRMKIILSLSAISVTLLVSSILSVMEYSRMSNYVSELIADNIRNINVAQKLAGVSNQYNLEILTVIGDSTMTALPAFDEKYFMDCCDSLRSALNTNNMGHLADSLEYSYSAYMLTSLELPKVLESDFIDTRTWYFDRLQPVYARLRTHIDNLSASVYKELQKNSATFERGFYRSIIPGAVAVAVGLMLILMLMFFLLAYFVNPIYRMKKGMDNYRSLGKAYNYTFDGDDELRGLNDGVTELSEENLQLRRRIKTLREAKTLREDES